MAAKAVANKSPDVIVPTPHTMFFQEALTRESHREKNHATGSGGRLRRVGSERILTSQPTLHYSPEVAEKPSKTNQQRTTAVKALPKPKPAAQPAPKMEATSPDTPTTEAVKASLNRASTMKSASDAVANDPSSSGEESGEDKVIGPNGGGNAPAAAQVRARKDAHARYMRFFRSARSNMASKKNMFHE